MAQLALTQRDSAQVLRETPGALGQRCLEPRRSTGDHAQGLVEPLRCGDEPPQACRVGVTNVAQMRNGRERRRGVARAHGALLDLHACGVGGGTELLDLGAQLTAPRLELEEHGLGRLTGEPQLPAVGVPADPVGGHRRDPGCKQLVARHDRQLHEVTRILPDEHDDRPEPRRLRLRHELEPACGIRREHGGGTVPERGGSRALGAGSHVEELQRELLALLGERAGRGRDSFALGERLLEPGEALTCEPDARLQIVALARRRSRRSVGLVGRPAELRRRRTRGSLLRLVELAAQLGEQTLRRLVPQAESLGGAAECMERVAATAGEHRLCLRAICEHRFELGREPRLRCAFDRTDPRPALLGFDLKPGSLGRGRLRGGGRSARS